MTRILVFITFIAFCKVTVAQENVMKTDPSAGD